MSTLLKFPFPTSALRTRALLGATLLFLAAAPASAVLHFSGSGFNAETGSSGQSAAADLSLVGNMLTLTLQNTTDVTTEQGDALTGILFDVASAVTLKLQSISLAEGSNLWLSQTQVNDSRSLVGSWTDVLASPPQLAASYGLATTGFNNEFVGSTITRGNASPDYGLIGANTLPTTRIGGARYPFVQKGLTFKLKVASGVLNLNDITNVRFLFGTAGNGVVQAEYEEEVPEPGILALLLLAFASAWLARRRVARRRATATV